jgi:D-glycero-alpha-D-manno-heptose 1-phosphate guanylyltransferase
MLRNRRRRERLPWPLPAREGERRFVLDVTAIILAGGKGTRLREVVADRPKVLAPVAGRPFLAYLLDQIERAGVCRVILSTGHMAEQFAEAIGYKHNGLTIEYAHEESPLGTGGAIKFAASKADSPHVLVMNGDSYFDADLVAYTAWHVSGGQDASLLLVEVPDASRFGTVELRPDGEHVAAFLEKQGVDCPGLINAGIYLLRREVISRIPDGPCSIERDVFPGWLDKLDVRGWVTDGEFIDIGIPTDYERSHDFMVRVTT